MPLVKRSYVICDRCGKEFEDKPGITPLVMWMSFQNFTAAKQYTDGSRRYYFCADCEKSFIDWFSIDKHSEQNQEEEKKTYTEEEAEIRNNFHSIEEALPGHCFHGEVWAQCPHCNKAYEMQSFKPIFIHGGWNIYKCNNCGKLFKDR